jgi:hypothetical protein
MEEEDVISVLLAESLQGDSNFQDLLSCSSQKGSDMIPFVMVHFSLQASLPSSIYTYNSGQDDALDTLCSFDHAFNEIHILFKEQFDSFTQYSKSGFIKKMRKRLIVMICSLPSSVFLSTCHGHAPVG